MSRLPANQIQLSTDKQPIPFQGSYMTYEQIDRYGLFKGPEEYLLLIREKRDYLLSLTDWIMQSETNISIEEKEQWRVYRQELRDVPQNFLIYNRVIWPEPPLVERLWVG